MTAEELLAAAGYGSNGKPASAANASAAPANAVLGCRCPREWNRRLAQSHRPGHPHRRAAQVDKFYLGDVPIRIEGGGKVMVDRQGLALPLKKVMKPEVVALLTKGLPGEPPDTKLADGDKASSPDKWAFGSWLGNLLAADQKHEKPAGVGARELKPMPPGTIPVSPPAYMSIEEIRALGINLRFDPLANELRVEPTVEQRPTGDISAYNRDAMPISANARRPALFSAYLNMRGAVDYVSQTTRGEDGLESPRFDFDSAVRISNVVLENEFTWDTDNRKGFTQDYFNNYGFYRRGSRIVYDLPEHVLRFKVGDVYPGFTSFQTAPDLLGFTVERSYSALRPGQNIRPTGQQSFRIDRPSDVDIVVDGAIVRRVRLAPGNYNVNDLPLRPGANNVILQITEDTGQRRMLEFTVFSDRSLLAPGINEFQVSAGIRSRPADSDWRDHFFGQPDYMWDSPAATAFYRRGLTESLTGELHAQGDDSVVMGGGGAIWQNKFGLFSADLAFSTSDHGLGYAIAGSYDLLNVRGWDGYRHSFRVSAEYKSDNFASIQQHDPHYDYWLNLAAIYARDLAWDITGSLSGRYSLAKDTALFDDRWSVDLSLSKRIWANLSGSLSVGYGEGGRRYDETRLACATCAGSLDSDGFHAFARLHYRIDDRSSISASHDTRNEVSHATYVRNEGSGVGSWNTVVDVANDQRYEEASVNGAVGYVGNRGEVSVSHASRLSGVSIGGAYFDPRSTEQRTSLRAETGIAFADGAFAVGRPVRNGFAIVEPHRNLKGESVSLGPRDSEIASSGALGPALVPDIFAYSTRRVEYDVPNLPLGYDLGASAFDFFAPYKAGYRLTVGSDYTVTALGTLIGRDGAPVPLLAGTAFEDGKNDGPKVQLFTNRAGRFGAQGLAPGRWVIEMPTEPATRYVLDVPANTVGLFDAGTLRPVR
ncbi:MAG: fimbrial biogenesis outer membrane usher protein [Hyphomicrobiaceae bacterium]